MPFIQVDTERDYPVNVYFQDYGEGKPVVLIHGWPLSHRMWEYQIDALVDAGYRVIAYDRRGFGSSDKPWNGYDYDTMSRTFMRSLRRSICKTRPWLVSRWAAARWRATSDSSARTASPKRCSLAR